MAPPPRRRRRRGLRGGRCRFRSTAPRGDACWHPACAPRGSVADHEHRGGGVGHGGSLSRSGSRYRSRRVALSNPPCPRPADPALQPVSRGRAARGDGREVTAHCPNPGAMLGLKEAGASDWLEPNDDPKRKLKFGWRLAELPGGHMAGIDTSVPNRVVAEALAACAVPALADYDRSVRRSPTARAAGSTFSPGGRGWRMPMSRVKNVHLLARGRLGRVSRLRDGGRGAKHLGELAAVAEAGHRAVMLYLVQRTDWGAGAARGRHRPRLCRRRRGGFRPGGRDDRPCNADHPRGGLAGPAAARRNLTSPARGSGTRRASALCIAPKRPGAFQWTRRAAAA